MDDLNYKSNSDKSREIALKKNTADTPPKLKPLNTEKKRFRDSIFFKDLKEVIISGITETLIPSLRDIIFDTGNELLHRVVYKNSTDNSRVPADRYVSYSSKYRYRNRRPSESSRNTETNKSAMKRFKFESERDANIFLDAMQETIDEYGSISVNTAYDKAGIPSNDYTLCNYGWFSLKTASIAQIGRGEWIVKLPKAVPLD